MASAEDCFFGGSVHQDGESSRSRANVDGTPLGTIFFPPTLHPHWAYVGGVVHSFFSYYSGSPTLVENNSKSLNIYVHHLKE